MQGEKVLLIVARRIIAWLDHEEAVLSAVLRARKVVHRHGMGVIPAKAGRPRRQLVADARTWGNGRGSFLERAIRLGRRKQAMPMDHFGPFRVVCHLDRDGLILLQPQQAARHLAVVGCGSQAVSRRQFKRDGRYVYLVVRSRSRVRNRRIPGAREQRGGEADYG
jgi:hypothetical protein